MAHHVLEGMVLIILMVFIHGAGSLVFLKMLMMYRPFWERHGGLLINTVSLAWVVGILVLLHLLEIAIWALFFFGRGVFSDLETCTYFSLITYTTVGYGDVVLPHEWRIMGSSEALVGILMTAWSTALLIGVVNDLHLKTIQRWKEKDKSAGRKT